MELNYVIPAGPVPDGANAVIIAADLRATGNRVVGIGAAIYAQSATLVITRGTFQSNQGGGSGGIALGARSHLTLTDSSFISNQATNMMAGAIGVRQGSIASIQRSTFISNTAKEAGGAIAVGESLSTLNADSCTFTNNQASIGSIIAFDPTPRVGSTVTNCRAEGNIASEHGGIFFSNVPTARNVNLTTNTFVNNQAPFAADYGSIAASIGFIAPTETQIGDSTHTPTILPAGYQTIISRTIDALQVISLRIILVDVFNQRITAPGIVNDAWFDVITVTPGASPAVLVLSNTRVKLIDGKADVSLTLVGQLSATYAIRVSTTNPLIPLARVNVAINACSTPGAPACSNCLSL
jgi:predicted outer membrane repeat protein